MIKILRKNQRNYFIYHKFVNWLDLILLFNSGLDTSKKARDWQRGLIFICYSLKVLEVQADVSGNVVVGLEGFYAFDIEICEPVGRQVRWDELGQVVEAGPDVGNAVTTDAGHTLVIPNVGIQFLQAFLAHLLEKVCFVAFLVVFFINIDWQDHSTCCNLRWSVVEEFRLVELEFANLETHIKDGTVQVVSENSEEALHWLDWAGEVEVEPKLDENIRF